ncbi:MAG: isochorismatase family cysteine hydrolase [Anaerolineales bacterium]
MASRSALGNSERFLAYIREWQAALPPLPIEEAVPDAGRAAIFSVDLVRGFCYEGPLASPRVKAIIPAVTELFRLAWGRGVRNFVLIQEGHEPDAREFDQYGRHCVRGTFEAETVPEIRALPFHNQMQIVLKNSISSFSGTSLGSWLGDHPEVDTLVAVGDCTDLCTYQLAMHMQVYANAHQRRRRVIVPSDCVDTYDLPVEAAASAGTFPHDGDLLNLVFLYHMALNGIEVVGHIGA